MKIYFLFSMDVTRNVFKKFRNIYIKLKDTLKFDAPSIFEHFSIKEFFAEYETSSEQFFNYERSKLSFVKLRLFSYLIVSLGIKNTSFDLFELKRGNRTFNITMPFGIPSLKSTSGMPDSFHFKDTGYGVSNPLHSGWNSARSQLASNHPLETAVKNFRNDQIRINNSVMLHAQGPAAPLIQAMELRAVKQVGRHPFLASSNFQLEVLTGRDMEMDFDDFLNVEEFKEIQAQPHIVMENLPLKPVF